MMKTTTARSRRAAPALIALVAAAVIAGCERPPPDVTQLGYRGVAMEQLDNPRTLAAAMRTNQAPQTTARPPVAPGTPTAGSVYQNVQVLGDLDVGSFTRLMAAITEWVSPEQGCAYCHQGANFANDDLYTKVVARRMLQMTQHINSSWKPHVAGNGNGVTCYTCHRGKPVPEKLWFAEPGLKQAGGMASSRQGQSLAMHSVAYSSLPYDPFSTFLLKDEEIRMQASAALPPGGKGKAIGTKATEHTYGLMMHMSQSLGVNCTYCHNSRAFSSWDQAPPARATAWHGIRMVRDLNVNYLEPLGPQYPANRIGKTGDAPKVYCTSCHNGQSKPLNGANMLQHFPSLAGG